MKIEIVPASVDHIPAIIAGSREREKREIGRIGSAIFEAHLRSSIDDSVEAWSGFIDDNIVCIYCVKRGSLMVDDATLWLWTTEELNKHPFVFVRYSQLRLAELRRRYHYLHGYVQSDNQASIKWLKWLGFNLGDAEWINGYAIRRFAQVS